MGPGDLEHILEGIRFSVDRKLLVGIEIRDDVAGSRRQVKLVSQ